MVTCVEERMGRSGGMSQELCDVSVVGKKFSYFCSDGKSMSRLDRCLVSEGLIARWNIASQWIGARDISNHYPIYFALQKIGVQNYFVS